MPDYMFRLRNGENEIPILQALAIAADPVLGDNIDEDVHRELHRESLRLIHKLSKETPS